MNPYKIDGPALIAFSGGRSSAYMLKHIIDAYGGALPPDVVACFCNTGLEHEATYAFVRECGERWSVPIALLEYDDDSEQRYRVVRTVCELARNGEPFSGIIRRRGILPNPVARFCTSELKIRTMVRYAKGAMGWDDWDEVVGIRSDERRRAARIKADTGGRDVVLPMVAAGVTASDVLAWWKEQPFDLEIPSPIFGNCVGCFLKGAHKLARVWQTNPDYARWWIEMEETPRPSCTTGGTFRSDRPTYRQQVVAVTVQGRMFDDAIEDALPDCFCGE